MSTDVRISDLKAVITITCCLLLGTFPHLLDIVLLLFVVWLLHNSSCSIQCQKHELFLFSCSPDWQRTAHKAQLQTKQDKPILPGYDLHSCITSILFHYKNSKHLIWFGLIHFSMSPPCEDVILVFWLFWAVAGPKLYRTIVCVCSCSLVQAMQDVQYLYSHELDMLYLVGKTGRDSHSRSRTEIFLPLSTVSDITPSWIQKVQDTLCTDQDKKG